MKPCELFGDEGDGVCVWCGHGDVAHPKVSCRWCAGQGFVAGFDGSTEDCPTADLDHKGPRCVDGIIDGDAWRAYLDSSDRRREAA